MKCWLFFMITLLPLAVAVPDCESGGATKNSVECICGNKDLDSSLCAADSDGTYCVAW